MKRTSEWLRRIWSSQTASELHELEESLGHRFRDQDLLRLALTHRSFANEKGLAEQNERLEFLGDAVLGLVTASMLFESYPDFPEGELSRRKSSLVSESALANVANDVGLGEVLRLGIGEDRSGGRNKPSLLSDAMEAVFGAIYLDGGLPAARTVIKPLLRREMERTTNWDRRDAKTKLQELVQSHGLKVPRYRMIDEEGPDHAKTFTVECRIDGRAVGLGQGTSKKAAEQEAARHALAAPDLLGEPSGDS